MIKIGSHVPFKKPDYLFGAIDISLKNKANTAMIFLGPPQSTMRTQPENYKFEQYVAEFSKQIPPADIVVHAPYILNLANPLKANFSIDFLVKEIEKMNFIGAKFLVLHPGFFTTYTRLEAKNQLVKSLKVILEKTKNVEILLETMAGKGTEMCSSFEEIVEIIQDLNSERIGVCLDTCHVWDAGYDLKNYAEFQQELIKTKIINHIKVIHLNDSVNPLGSKKDRHANIDKGFIGLETLQKIVHDPLFDNIPIILETPYVDNKPIYDQEIALLLKK
ncbi:deoxyribonuclease IV [Mesomycoplasma ovipneumoniae]|uniref:deoxyribonuclease IV n=1 Tax=Mesomycoplasma ovipneumoniae TaxID=29562 RepID=UPI0028ACC8F9|nr:deoxyribonuclease IV [Mesomycoplasma ovipneumoniae]MDW2933147.1 deoxyribonuclease IV [Mesomycoplasma ovipneumoniae]WNM15718.1 deoxyribonuclease IV [Mesomycoplasma ovipneumoniae]